MAVIPCSSPPTHTHGRARTHTHTQGRDGQDLAVMDRRVPAKKPGLVSVAIEADQRQFQLYAGGVFTGACGTKRR